MSPVVQPMGFTPTPGHFWVEINTDSINRALKKSARRNGFPSGWATAFSIGSFDAVGMPA